MTESLAPNPSDGPSMSDELEMARREIRSLRDTVGKLQNQIMELNGRVRAYENKLNLSWNQVRAMRTSRSWQITLPLRLMRRRR